MACQACGWAAAACSMLAGGSFGVPIKSDAARSVDIDPLVFQSYKTFVCFATSWLILLTGEKFSFSPWGIVSGLFWVPGGIATVYAVKAAGLAIGIGMASTCIILSSFTWGIFVFQEKVRSKSGACLAVLCLMMGLLGMSYYSSPEPAAVPNNDVSSLEISQRRRRDEQNNRTSRSLTPTRKRRAVLSVDLDASDRSERTGSAVPLTRPLIKRPRKKPMVRSSSYHSDGSDDLEIILLTGEVGFSSVIAASSGIETVVVLGRKLPKREWGMFLAGVFGLWGGSIMAPMKLAPSDTQGAHFLLSFSIGASIVTLVFWAVRYLYNVYQHRSLSEAYAALPSLHLRVMWVAGGASGLLWSIGNFFNLITVYYLGQGVGYPLVQSSMLVSGLWGIFYFKEIQGTERICKWLVSSLVTICGIMMLSYEHVDE